jgi:hypothetical protein
MWLSYQLNFVDKDNHNVNPIDPDISNGGGGHPPPPPPPPPPQEGGPPHAASTATPPTGYLGDVGGFDVATLALGLIIGVIIGLIIARIR